MIPVPPRIQTSICLDTIEIGTLKTRQIIPDVRKLWKSNARVATTIPILLTGIQTIDGVLLSQGDVVLVKNQVNTIENGLYIVSGSTWTRSSNLSSGTIAQNATVLIEEGDKFGRNIFTTISSFEVGTSPMIFKSAYFSGTPPAGNDGDIQLADGDGGFAVAVEDVEQPEFNQVFKFIDDTLYVAPNIYTNILQVNNIAELGNNITPGTYSYPMIRKGWFLINQISNAIMPANPTDTQSYIQCRSGDTFGPGAPIFFFPEILIFPYEVNCTNVTPEGILLPDDVTAGTYTNASISVNNFGKITSISSGDIPVGTNGSFQFNNGGSLTSSSKFKVSDGVELETTQIELSTTGSSTLVNGTVTVAVTATGPNGMTDYTVIVTRTNSNGSTIGNLYVENKTPISFDVNSYIGLAFNNLDQSTFDLTMIFIN